MDLSFTNGICKITARWPLILFMCKCFCAACASLLRSRCVPCCLDIRWPTIFLFTLERAEKCLYQLVIVPLWVSYLVRGYAWKTILGSDGVLNGFLQYLHFTNAPVGFLLYSPFAVILMLTHIYTPFVFLPIYAALEHIPRSRG